MKALNKILLPTLLIIVMVSCEKDKPNTVITEDPNEYKVFFVHAQKTTNKETLRTYNLCFIQTTWNLDGRSYKDSVMFYDITNINGDATFKIKSIQIQKKGNIFYYIGTSINNSISIPDSLKNELKYANGVEVYHNGNANYYSVLNASPTCELKYEITKNISIEKNIDSLFVSNISFSAYEDNTPKYILIGEETYYSFIKADCSTTNTIKYYYYSNGVKSKEYTKTIYVPFSSQGLDIVICTLDFK